MTRLEASQRFWLLPFLIAALVGVIALWLTARIGALGLWPLETQEVIGRAMLGATGTADPSTLLAAYPPLPYMLVSAAEIVTRPSGLSPAALITALLAAGFVATFAATLTRAGYSQGSTLLLVVLLCIHPFGVRAISGGPEMMLLLWGVWLMGVGAFGTRVTGGVHSLAALTLSLPLLALTDVQGAVIAACSIPFLLLAIPPHFVRRSYGSMYVVLLYPLVFAGFAMMVMAAILMHDPLAFVTTEMLEPRHWSNQSWLTVAGFCAAAVIGCLILTVGLIARTRQRRPLQSAATMMLGTITLAVIVGAILGITSSATDLLVPTVAASALTATRWPREDTRVIRVLTLTGIGLLLAYNFMLDADTRPVTPITQAITGGEVPLSADAALGRFLATRHDVTIDAAAHPAVVVALGNANGLVTDQSSMFGTSLLTRRIFTRYVAVPAHHPGVTDDQLARNLPNLYDRGSPGYHLIYDRLGWRVWSRISAGGKSQ